MADPVLLIKERWQLESGRAYGEVMEDWQEAFFRAVFARGEGDRPKYRLLYDERRRGESKTEDCAAAALADLITGPPGHTSFVVAAATTQAGLLLDSIRGFKLRTPLLADIEIGKEVVRSPNTRSEIRVLSTDVPSGYGLRPRKIFFDELSLQANEKLWNVMFTSIGKRPQSQLIAVSMAGWDFTSIAWKVREQIRGDARYYFHTREGSTLAPWLDPADMEEQRAFLHYADFARYWECRWVEPQGSWITREMYDLAEVGQEAIGRGQPSVGFVDIGLVHDATAVAVCHSEGERVVLDTLRTLQGDRDQPVQLEVLEELVRDLTRRYSVRHWIFESPQAAASVQRLAATLPARVEIRHPTVETQARLWGNLYRLFANHLLTVYDHPRLRKEALLLVTRAQGGRLKVVESTATHQDHILAVGGAAEMLEAAKRSNVVAIYGAMTDEDIQQSVSPVPVVDKDGDQAWPAGWLK